MTQLLDRSAEQRFIQTGVSWQQFKAIQSSFADFPGVRLFYYEGEVEILGVSPEHEIYSRIIGVLLAAYFEEQEIEFTPTGSFTQEKEGEASAQADESYFIGNLGTIPDLSIEVVFTSGGVNKLNRYRQLGVPEVWFWEDGLFTLYRLEGQSYRQVSASEVLPDLSLKLLTQCILMAQTSRLEAIKQFRKGIRGQ